MPTTRKKVIKTIYKDDEHSENEGKDFSDSGSEAVITDPGSSEDEEEEDIPSDDDFQSKKSFSFKTKRQSNSNKPKKTKFAKSFINKIDKQHIDTEDNRVSPVLFSVKDLTDADKLLPSFLNLSESDSSDDESSNAPSKQNTQPSMAAAQENDSDVDMDSKVEYKDVWSENFQESEEIAKKTFMELEQQNTKIEETKISIQNYSVKNESNNVSDVKDLLALGEDEVKDPSIKSKRKIVKKDSDSEMEDWEEVKDVKGIPQQGLQLVVGIPDAVCRKTKKLDIEMMMKRKMNRVKKEYQVYMHKVHVLCWLGHGNYVSQVLNDREILAAALSLIPSKDSYPGERVDMKFVEQIATWYKDKVWIKQDKNENKFKPKAPPLKELLLKQVKSKEFTTKKYMVFIFVSMLRSLGLQCRVMFNFVTMPIRPPSSELCSLSTKPKENDSSIKKNEEKKASTSKSAKASKTKKTNLAQLDGNYDSSCESDHIMQLDGNDDSSAKTRRQKTNAKNINKKQQNDETDPTEESVSPPKRSRRRADLISQETKNQGEASKVTQSKIKEKDKSRSASPKPHQIIEKVVNRDQNLDTDTSIRQPSPRRARTKVIEKIVESAPKIKATNAIKKKSTPKVDHTNESSNSSGSQLHETKQNKKEVKNDKQNKKEETSISQLHSRRTRNRAIEKTVLTTVQNNEEKSSLKKTSAPKIIITNENNISSKYFQDDSDPGDDFTEASKQNRKRSLTTEPKVSKNQDAEPSVKKPRARSAHNVTENKSKYFISKETVQKGRSTKKDSEEDKKRVSHKDLAQKKTNSKNDVTGDLVKIIKGRVKAAKEDAKKGIVKEKIKPDSDEDSDYLPVESPNRKKSESDDDFKPKKITPKRTPTAKKIDRRVLSTENDLPLHKIDVWCEVFVEELEEWVAVDVIKGKVHCVKELYNRATHPVAYVVGWDNNNYLKDLTRRYVPQWNTVTRKQRVERSWWEQAIKAWLGPKTARDREEDERLDQMQLEAPLPTSIAEYKNHPLYALKRHLLKFEALYPPDAATLGFVRGEAVYARDCVYVCRSRDTWLKEAKVVRLGEQPYKVVKARPKWDKLSNKLITDKPLEVFGPWQVKDYEPPVAENGVVPRNPYGNVELFKDCMLPKGTVHIKLPGLNRVAKKLNIDCAPAMTGFEFNGGWSHPVYDGFVVCKEFETVITEAWLKDQEEQERREIEKMEARVYGNWRKLIRGLLIKERLKAKYGFDEPSTSQNKKKMGPRLVVKKK